MLDSLLSLKLRIYFGCGGGWKVRQLARFQVLLMRLDNTYLRRRRDQIQLASEEHLRQGCGSRGDSKGCECERSRTVGSKGIASVGRNGIVGAPLQFGQSENALLGDRLPPWLF